MGFLWLGTVPLVSGIVGRIFGIRYLSMLYGIVFLSHQLGSFFGAWLAGLIFDSTGSYHIAWGFSIALGLFAGERKSVGSGKSVSDSVEDGGCRIIKTKDQYSKIIIQT